MLIPPLMGRLNISLFTHILGTVKSDAFVSLTFFLFCFYLSIVADGEVAGPSSAGAPAGSSLTAPLTPAVSGSALSNLTNDRCGSPPLTPYR